MSEQKNQEVKETTNDKKVAKRKISVRTIVVLLAIVIFAFTSYISYRSSYLNFISVGENYEVIFNQKAENKARIFTISAVTIFFYVLINTAFIKKGLKKFFEDEKKEMPKLLNKSIAFITAIIVSALTSGLILEKAMLFFNSASFGTQDPIFGLDIGYFVFQKPFIELVAWYFMIAMIALLLYTVVYYITTFNMFFDGVEKH